MALDEVRDLVSSGQIPPGVLAQVDRELEILDRDWPPFATSIKNESMLMQITLLSEELGLPRGYPSMWSAWRYGFSAGLMRADAGSQMARFAELAIRLESMTWVDQMAAAEGLRKEMLEVKNPLVVQYSGVLVSSVSVRQRRAQLRMLRIAARFMCDGTVIELDDPYGGKVKTVNTGSLRIWSCGRDGVDNGGAGGWSNNNSGRDIVLEMAK